jgi:DNA-binding MarR family transcriptional regulator
MQQFLPKVGSMAQSTHAPPTAWRLFIHAHAGLLEVLETELRAERGLPLTWFEVLLFLSRAPDRRLRMTALAGSLLLSKSGLTRLVDRMVDAGLIERSVCPSDRRGVFVGLSRRGIEEFEAALPIHLEGVEEHFARHLGPGELEAMESALSKILAAMRSRDPGQGEEGVA